MHHKFELEEMQKDLELLLQAQQPSLQLNQTKSPQHLQQTIVGQINYIVRQPAPVQSQSQEDTVQVRSGWYHLPRFSLKSVRDIASPSQGGTGTVSSS